MIAPKPELLEKSPTTNTHVLPTSLRVPEGNSEQGGAADLLALHQRLCHGDPLAPDDLLGRLLPRLIQKLARKFPFTDSAFVWNAAADALLEYLARPLSFDEKHSVPLDQFLFQAARCNLDNSIRNENRRKNREAAGLKDLSKYFVESELFWGITLWKDKLGRDSDLDEIKKGLKSSMDREIFELWRQKASAMADYANVMNLAALPPDQLHKAVKRAKDRIMKQLQRIARKQRDDTYDEEYESKKHGHNEKTVSHARGCLSLDRPSQGRPLQF